MHRLLAAAENWPHCCSSCERALGVSQSFCVYPALSLRAAYAPPNRRWPMILSAIAEKLKRTLDGLVEVIGGRERTRRLNRRERRHLASESSLRGRSILSRG